MSHPAVEAEEFGGAFGRFAVERDLIPGGRAAHDIAVGLAWSAGILMASGALAARSYARMGL